MQEEKPKTLIKVPFKAGWKMVSIKAANFRYIVVALQNPVAPHTIEDRFLFVGGAAAPYALEPFLVAACIECGAKATHLCGHCMDVGYCLEHTHLH